MQKRWNQKIELQPKANQNPEAVVHLPRLKPIPEGRKQERARQENRARPQAGVQLVHQRAQACVAAN